MMIPQIFFWNDWLKTKVSLTKLKWTKPNSPDNNILNNSQYILLCHHIMGQRHVLNGMSFEVAETRHKFTLFPLIAVKYRAVNLSQISLLICKIGCWEWNCNSYRDWTHTLGLKYSQRPLSSNWDHIPGFRI